MDYFQHTPVIRAQRLHLRKLTMKDAGDIFEYSRDPLVAEHVLWDAHRSVSESKGYIRYMMRKYRYGEPSSWGIVWDAEEKVIGTIGFMWIQPENAAAEVGYSLARRFWNRGIMTRAVEEICQIAFDKLELIRITANVYEPNIASVRVLEKNGFILEGRMRKAVKKADRIYDVCIYGKVR